MWCSGHSARRAAPRNLPKQAWDRLAFRASWCREIGYPAMSSLSSALAAVGALQPPQPWPAEAFLFVWTTLPVSPSPGSLTGRLHVSQIWLRQARTSPPHLGHALHGLSPSMAQKLSSSPRTQSSLHEIIRRARSPILTWVGALSTTRVVSHRHFDPRVAHARKPAWSTFCKMANLHQEVAYMLSFESTSLRYHEMSLWVLQRLCQRSARTDQQGISRISARCPTVTHRTHGQGWSEPGVWLLHLRLPRELEPGSRSCCDPPHGGRSAAELVRQSHTGSSPRDTSRGNLGEGWNLSSRARQTPGNSLSALASYRFNAHVNPWLLSSTIGRGGPLHFTCPTSCPGSTGRRHIIAIGTWTITTTSRWTMTSLF